MSKGQHSLNFVISDVILYRSTKMAVILPFCTVNREIFIVKIFSLSMAAMKINLMKTRALLTLMWYRVVPMKVS